MSDESFHIVSDAQENDPLWSASTRIHSPKNSSSMTAFCNLSKIPINERWTGFIKTNILVWYSGSDGNVSFMALKNWYGMIRMFTTHAEILYRFVPLLLSLAHKISGAGPGTLFPESKNNGMDEHSLQAIFWMKSSQINNPVLNHSLFTFRYIPILTKWYRYDML